MSVFNAASCRLWGLSLRGRVCSPRRVFAAGAVSEAVGASEPLRTCQGGSAGCSSESWCGPCGTRHGIRGPRERSGQKTWARITPGTLISERPAEVDDRVVRGYWEVTFDRAGRVAIVVVVERSTSSPSWSTYLRVRVPPQRIHQQRPRLGRLRRHDDEERADRLDVQLARDSAGWATGSTPPALRVLRRHPSRRSRAPLRRLSPSPVPAGGLTQ